MKTLRELLPEIAQRIVDDRDRDDYSHRIEALAIDVDGYVRCSRYAIESGREIIDGDWTGYEWGIWPKIPIVGDKMEDYMNLGKTSISSEEDKELFDELNLMIEMAKL